jgi:hypothetical protein
VADGINLRLGRRDMNVFRTIDRAGERPVVHVAGRHLAALCPSCAHPSVDTNGTGWRDVIDVVRTLVITLSVCVRRFVCSAVDEGDDVAVLFQRARPAHVGQHRSLVGPVLQAAVQMGEGGDVEVAGQDLQAQ